MTCRRSLVVMAMSALLGWSGAARACAVATQLRVENQGNVLVRTLRITSLDEDPSSPDVLNLLPSRGLPPRQEVSVPMPSCVGRYIVTAAFADGRVLQYRDVDASTARALALR